jgi:hypothetical protein
MAQGRSDKSFEYLFDRRVVLYGAGLTGVETHKVLTRHFADVDVACFCDTHKTGSMSGLPIISPGDLKEMCSREPILVFVTGLSENERQIADGLRDLEIPDEWIYLLSDLHALAIEHIDDPRISEWYRRIMINKARLPTDKGRGLYLNWWCPEHYCDGDILVYQPGKVGSSSICHSLFASGISSTHVHMLTERFIFDLIPEISWIPTPEELATIQRCSQYCSAGIKSANTLKIISLVRDPLGRDYSQFVYHLGELVNSGYPAPSASLLELCVDGLRRRATQNGKCPRGYQFEWFEYELKEVFGIDVYASPFDKEQGYSIIRQGNVEVLLIKLERLNDLASVIADFCGANNLSLVTSNQARSKSYSGIYASLRESVQIPGDLISLYYNGNPYVDHFYGKTEKDNFLTTWKIL